MKCEFCKIWLPIIVILVAGFYIAWQFVPQPAANTLRIATGSEEGAYYQYAEEYQKHLRAEGVDLEILPTAGSVEALKLLQEKQVDLAFIQGGVAKDIPKGELHSIASLFYEPLWGFYRKDLGTIAYLHELQGKRLAVGIEGSGTQALTLQLLSDNGIQPDNTKLLNVSGDEAAKKLESGEVDAAFFVSSPTTETISKLVKHDGIAMMDFARHARAYTSHYPFLNSLILGEGLLDLQNNIPGHDSVLLTATAALVARKDVHSDHIRLLSREAIRVHSQPGMLEKAREFPSIQHLEIPIHPEAEQYLQHGPSWLEKIFPFSIASRLDQLKVLLIPLATLLIPLIKGMMPLYKWRIRSKIYRWYKELNQIDRKLDHFKLGATERAMEKLIQLHGELAKEVSVPLSHMAEFYALRVHADHVISRLKERRAALQPPLPMSLLAVDEEALSQPQAIETSPVMAEQQVPKKIEVEPEQSSEIDMAQSDGNDEVVSSKKEERKEVGDRPFLSKTKKHLFAKNSEAKAETMGKETRDLNLRNKVVASVKKGVNKVADSHMLQQHAENRRRSKQKTEGSEPLSRRDQFNVFMHKIRAKIPFMKGKTALGNTTKQPPMESPEVSTKAPFSSYRKLSGILNKKKKNSLGDPLASKEEEKPKSSVSANTTLDNQPVVSNTDEDRHQQAQNIVKKHMLAGMTVSVVPIPLIDIAGLTTTQLNMLHSLSIHYGVDFNKKRGKATLVSMIGGSLPTTALVGVSSLTKIIPGIGTLGGSASLSALAGAMVYASGQVFIKHFESGGGLHNFNGKHQRSQFQQAMKEGLTVKTA
ncbi:MAG: TRAP transporter solute receptor, TAXI family [uncultured Thiotrichaceae bacterium]|uniref:TRAP transporter solute receptor, TAXI family n=1 Tax=uncultured Thiotrichaceae bacterium TaxID=298394 RepID=A0A6S6UAF8_9GAMM|nr:MAG: TRAP transporter solute receptor, TAXI family [uncultured Thiotrichaceae bacterium]